MVQPPRVGSNQIPRFRSKRTHIITLYLYVLSCTGLTKNKKMFMFFIGTCT